MDVHQDSIAVASGAEDHPPDVVFLGAMGTRPCDIDPLIRRLQSKRQHLVFVYEACPPQTTPVVRGVGRARSPRGEAPLPAGRCLKALGQTALRPRGAAISNAVSKNSRSRSSISVGRHRCGCANATASSAPAAHTPIRGWWPWRGNGSPAGGPSPGRDR